MKLKTRIWALPVSAGAVFTVGCAVSVLVAASAHQRMQDFQTVDYPARVALTKVDRSVESLRLTLQTAATEGDEAQLDDVASRERQALDHIRALGAVRGHAAEAEALEQSAVAFAASGAAATRALIANAPDAAGAVALMQKHLSELEGLVERASQDADAASTASQQAMARDVQHLLLALLATCGAALLSLGLASRFIVSSVLRDLGDEPDRLREAMSRVSQGDLRRAETQASVPAHSVRAVLSDMTDQLLALVASIQGATESIAHASNEIAEGNRDLSFRTETTAANLQRTASTVEQLTATVRQTAEAARQAHRLAAEAQQAAQQGGSIVTQVVTSMGQIQEASGRINAITGVIDGIAFQTNILALNAAVEAARAGEQGRGFAVVASEVRGLAQRSADAAREIKTLILDSTDKVRGGTELVGQAGQTMLAIVGGVQQVTEVIGAITTAAAEQSAGVENVNLSVAEIDQFTQQNAALVEQSAAAAASLREQAETLARTVSVFRIEADAAA